MSDDVPSFVGAVTSPNATMSLDDDGQTPFNTFGGVSSNCADNDAFGDDVRCAFGSSASDAEFGGGGGGADENRARDAAVGGGASKDNEDNPMAPKRVQAPSFVQTTPKPLVMPSVRFTIPPLDQQVCALRVGGPQYAYSPCAAVGFTCAGCFPSQEEAVAFYASRTRAGDERFGPIVTFPLDKPFLIGSNLPTDASRQAARIAEILRKSAAAAKKKTDALMDDIRHQRSWDDQTASARPTQEEFSRAYKEKWDAMQPAMEERARERHASHTHAQSQQAAKKKKKKRGNNWSRKKKKAAQTTTAPSVKAANADAASWPNHLLVPDQQTVVFSLAYDPDDDGPLKEQYVVTVFGVESSNERAKAFISDCVQRDRKNYGPIYSHPMFKPILPDITNLDGFERSVSAICETSEQQDLMDAMDPNSDMSKMEARQVAELEAHQMQTANGIASSGIESCNATDVQHEHQTS